MITQQALQEAIAECQGVKSPNRETCMMLAAFYTIQDHLYGNSEQVQAAYSYAPAPADIVREYGETDFLRAVAGKDAGKVWAVLDELAETVQLIHPRLYDSTMTALAEIK